MAIRFGKSYLALQLARKEEAIARERIKTQRRGQDFQLATSLATPFLRAGAGALGDWASDYFPSAVQKREIDAAAEARTAQDRAGLMRAYGVTQPEMRLSEPERHAHEMAMKAAQVQPPVQGQEPAFVPLTANEIRRQSGIPVESQPRPTPAAEAMKTEYAALRPKPPLTRPTPASAPIAPRRVETDESRAVSALGRQKYTDINLARGVQASQTAANVVAAQRHAAGKVRVPTGARGKGPRYAYTTGPTKHTAQPAKGDITTHEQFLREQGGPATPIQAKRRGTGKASLTIPKPNQRIDPNRPEMPFIVHRAQAGSGGRDTFNTVTWKLWEKNYSGLPIAIEYSDAWATYANAFNAEYARNGNDATKALKAPAVKNAITNLQVKKDVLLEGINKPYTGVYEETLGEKQKKQIDSQLKRAGVDIKFLKGRLTLQQKANKTMEALDKLYPEGYDVAKGAAALKYMVGQVKGQDQDLLLKKVQEKQAGKQLTKAGLDISFLRGQLSKQEKAAKAKEVLDELYKDEGGYDVEKGRHVINHMIGQSNLQDQDYLRNTLLMEKTQRDAEVEKEIRDALARENLTPGGLTAQLSFQQLRAAEKRNEVSSDLRDAAAAAGVNLSELQLRSLQADVLHKEQRNKDAKGKSRTAVPAASDISNVPREFLSASGFVRQLEQASGRMNISKGVTTLKIGGDKINVLASTLDDTKMQNKFDTEVVGPWNSGRLSQAIRALDATDWLPGNRKDEASASYIRRLARETRTGVRDPYINTAYNWIKTNANAYDGTPEEKSEHGIRLLNQHWATFHEGFRRTIKNKVKKYYGVK